MTTCLQQQTEWISDTIRAVREQGKSVIEPTKEGEDAWVAHHEEIASATLVPKTHSWYQAVRMPASLGAYSPISAVWVHIGRNDEEAAADTRPSA